MKLFKRQRYDDPILDQEIEALCYNSRNIDALQGKIGTDTDYVEFATDGSMEMVGSATVFEDLSSSTSGLIVSGVGVSVNGAESRIDYLASANTSDYSWTGYQMRHAWKPGSTLNPHIHWEQAANNIPNWLIQYRWQTNGDAKTTSWTNYKCNTPVFTYVSGTLNQICHGAGLTPPGGYGLSDILQVRIIRDTGNTSTLFTGADPYSGTVGITSSDCHMELSRTGSRTEYAF